MHPSSSRICMGRDQSPEPRFASKCALCERADGKRARYSSVRIVDDAAADVGALRSAS